MADNPNQQNNLEQSLEKLENLVGQLEKGELSLEESLSIYEQGMKLSKQCQQMLNGIEGKIESINEEHRQTTTKGEAE